MANETIPSNVTELFNSMLNVTNTMIDAGLSSASNDTSTPTSSDVAHCTKGSLTSLYGWIIQGILASLAFTCLIVKRFCEPKEERRSWKIWFFDTSKQAFASLVIHLINILIAEMFGGVDPCTQYIISFVLDSTVGLFVIFVGITLTQYVATKKGIDFLLFGEYGNPTPQWRIWYYQTLAYILIAFVAKMVVTIVSQLHFWTSVQTVLLWPFTSPQVELFMVLLVVPFFFNVLMFWVTDNLLTMNRSIRSSKVASVSCAMVNPMKWKLPICVWRKQSEDETDLIEVSMDYNPFAAVPT